MGRGSGSKLFDDIQTTIVTLIWFVQKVVIKNKDNPKTLVPLSEDLFLFTLLNALQAFKGFKLIFSSLLKIKSVSKVAKCYALIWLTKIYVPFRL